MRIVNCRVVGAALVAVVVAAGHAAAGNNPNGLVFRAVGWFQGPSSGTNCQVPNTGSAIVDSGFAMGLWNTFGFPNLHYPDRFNPFANPCGGWLWLQNNMVSQSILLDRIELRFRIAGARRYRQFVPTRNGFPMACRHLRRSTIYVGGLVPPFTNEGDTQSGAPNVVFAQVVPMVSAEMFNCLRGQYGPLSTDVVSSLPLVIRARVVGLSDNGTQYRSNTVRYSLNLRKTCGNGRRDDGEICDPAEPEPCGGSGTCTTSNVPQECVCVF